MAHTVVEHDGTRQRACACGDPDCLYLGRWGADAPLPGYEPASPVHLHAWWNPWGRFALLLFVLVPCRS